MQKVVLILVVIGLGLSQALTLAEEKNSGEEDVKIVSLEIGFLLFDPYMYFRRKIRVIMETNVRRNLIDQSVWIACLSGLQFVMRANF